MKTFVLLALALVLAVGAPALAVEKHHGKHDGHHGKEKEKEKDPKTEPPTDKPGPQIPVDRRTQDRLDQNGDVRPLFPTWAVVRRSTPTQLVFGPWMRPEPECASYVRRFPTLYVCVMGPW